MWRIELRSAALSRQLSWDGRPLVLGRDDACGLALPDESVSRRHVRLAMAGQRLSVEDLTSANGTWCRGQRLTQALLKIPAQLQLGDATFVAVVYAEVDASRQPPARTVIALLGILALATWLAWDFLRDEQAAPQYAAAAAKLPALPTLPEAQLWQWAAAQARDGVFAPGALAWAVRAYEQVAAGDSTLATPARESAERLKRALQARQDALEFEARRALGNGDPHRAKSAAARLRQEAAPWDLAREEQAKLLLGQAAAYEQ